jgi:hypothetical protein
MLIPLRLGITRAVQPFVVCIGGVCRCSHRQALAMRPDLAPPQRGFFVRVLPLGVQPTVVLYRWVCLASAQEPAGCQLGKPSQGT